MSEMFKLKISIGNANVELEGDGNLVHTIFTELREQGLGQLSTHNSYSSFVENNNTELPDENTDVTVHHQTAVDTDSFIKPNIKDVVIKDLPNSESEWVLIYALYASEEGTSTFTSDDLRQMYKESNRMTDVRNKNFSTNVKKAVSSDWFTTVNSTEYALTAKGKSFALDILQRDPSTNKTSSKKPKQSHTKMEYQMIELGLSQDERKEMKEYFSSFIKLNNMEKTLVLSLWLAKNKRINEVNENTIFTALRTIGHPTSFDIGASLKNGKHRYNYFSSSENPGQYKIHHIGEDHVTELENSRG